ncbi:MAG: T9SS type A sorting domain-containing protein [Bacteroidota bacterium]
MKRVLLLAVICFQMATGYTQTQRKILLEEFTSATCPPCVSANTRFHNWQIQNPDKFSSIYYHVNWPAPGDPMNLANPSENSARVGFYGVSYVPQSNLDGNYFNGSASGWSMTTINNRYAMPSPFEIQLQHSLSSGQDSVFSTMLIKCTQDISASMTAHNVIIEKWIHFNSAPCASSNGERDFYNVMKKMLPGSNGTTIASSMAAGDYLLVEGAWKFGTVYDKSMIASVGFVQNKSTREIYQTANSSANALVLPYNNDVQVMEVLNIPDKTCKNNIAPFVRIRNNGNGTIGGMIINYKINDGPLSSFTWTGALASMQKTVVALPEYLFDILPQNVITIYTTSPNNSPDQYVKNDTIHYNFSTSPISTNEIALVLRTDNAPQETTWDVKNSQGITLASGGPYSISSQIIRDTIHLPQADCYTFTIHDTGGDGICCAKGIGVYSLSSGSTIIRQGGQFGFSEVGEFWMDALTSVEEENNSNSMNVYPNPFDGSAKVLFQLNKSSDVFMNLYSVFGKLVTSISLGSKSAGQHETLLDGAGLKPGIYILQLKTDSGIYSRKVSVIR